MRRFLTPRWLAAHLLAVVLIAAMLGLAWWQIGRARGGNALSIGYSLEWPVFAAFVVFVWYRAVRGANGTKGAESPAPVPVAAPPAALPRRVVPVVAEDDPETAAYNHYLAWLGAHPHRRPSDYPGMEP